MNPDDDPTDPPSDDGADPASGRHRLGEDARTARPRVGTPGSMLDDLVDRAGIARNSATLLGERAGRARRSSALVRGRSFRGKGR